MEEAVTRWMRHVSGCVCQAPHPSFLSSPPLRCLCPSLFQSCSFSSELSLSVSPLSLFLHPSTSQIIQLIRWPEFLCCGSLSQLPLLFLPLESPGLQVKNLSPPSFLLLCCYLSSCLCCRSLLLFLLLRLLQSVHLTATHAQCFHTHMHTYTLSLSVSVPLAASLCMWLVLLAHPPSPSLARSLSLWRSLPLRLSRCSTHCSASAGRITFAVILTVYILLSTALRMPPRSKHTHKAHMVK